MKQREVIGITVRLTKVLGKGAFGEVFLAQPLPSALGHGEDVDYPPFFALKIIPLRLCGKSTLTEIEREMTAVERFHHPHIVSAVDKWLETGPSQYKGSFCLAMTLCNGGDLGMYINKQRARGFPLSVDFVARVMVHILSALNYSHSKGVIHRDIKPTNVFIVNETPPTRGEDGEVIPKVVVGDFGLSRPLEHSSEMAKTRVGTPGYLSPEIIQSKPYNFKTDIFSAGVLFYELMTLEKPFWKPHYTNGNIFWCTIATDPVPNLIKTCKDWAGHSLCEMVSRMLSKDPIQRPTAYEALTQYSSRLKSIVADELILTIPDYQFFTSPCSQLAIQEHKSLVGPELLIKPSLSDSLKEENKGGKPRARPSPDPDKMAKGIPLPEAGVQKANQVLPSPRRRTVAENLSPVLAKKPPPDIHADPLKGGKPKVIPGKSLANPSPMRNVARQRLALKDEGKKKAKSDQAEEKQKDENDAVDSPKKSTERLRQLKHCLTGQSPFASPLDSALLATVNYDGKAFFMAKIMALSKEDGERHILASLQSCENERKEHRRILYEMLGSKLSLG